MLECMDKPSTAGILTAHKQKELEPSMDMPVNQDDNPYFVRVLAALFREQIGLPRLDQHCDVPSPNAIHRRHLAIENKLRMHRHKLGDPDNLHAVWSALFVPRHTACLFKPKSGGIYIAITMDVTEYGIIMLPMSRNGVTPMLMDWGATD